MGAGREMEGDGGSRLCYEIVYESVDPDGGHASNTLPSTRLLHSTLLLFYSTLLDSTSRLHYSNLRVRRGGRGLLARGLTRRSGLRRGRARIYNRILRFSTHYLDRVHVSDPLVGVDFGVV